jgi:hypothetical protein
MQWPEVIVAAGDRDTDDGFPGIPQGFIFDQFIFYDAY